MPVLLNLPQDPFDLVLAGEQMRAAVLERPMSEIGNCLGGSSMTGFSSVVADEDMYQPMNTLIEINRLSQRRPKNGELQLRVNAGIATPCGAWVWLDWPPLLNQLLWASDRFAISGTTKDSTGAALGSCRVVALETGRIGVNGIEASAGETVSDGSGNYTLPVPTNTAYQLIAYKAGAPDVSGSTRADVVPTAVG